MDIKYICNFDLEGLHIISGSPFVMKNYEHHNISYYISKSYKIQVKNVNSIFFLCVMHKLFIFNRTGRWDLSADVCQLTSTLNLTVWLQHMLVFAMLKIDKGPNTNIDGKAVEHILQCSDSLPIASPPAE